MNNIIRFIFIKLLLLAIVVLTSCSKLNEKQNDTQVDAKEEYEPVTIETKDRTITFTEMPERVVTLEHNATEIMLALGLEKYMVGTAFRTADILSEYKDTYDKIPVIADKYPSKEAMLEVNPDFAFAGINIFQEDHVGSVEELASLGINTYYLQSTNLVDATIDDVFEDIRNIGKIFKVEDRAEKLINSLEQEIENTSDKIESYQDENNPIKVFAYQSGEDKLFATTKGIVTSLIEKAGGKNILDHVKDGPNANVSFEAVVDGNPEVIIIYESYANANESYGDAEEKKQFLLNHPALDEVDAIKNERFGVIPTVNKFEGVRVAILYEEIAKSLYPEAFE